MAQPRGPNGTVRGMGPATVKKLHAIAVELLRQNDTFSRADARLALKVAAEQLGHEIAEDEYAAMEHAFFRTVTPEALADGLYLLPRYAELLVQHRAYRLPGARMSLADIIQYASIMDHAMAEGVFLAPALREQHQRCKAALKALRISLPRMEDL